MAGAQRGVAPNTQNSAPHTTAKSRGLMYNISVLMGALWGGGLTIASQYKKNVQMQSNEIWARSVVWKLQSTDERNQRPRKRGGHHAD